MRNLRFSSFLAPSTPTLKSGPFGPVETAAARQAPKGARRTAGKAATETSPPPRSERAAALRGNLDEVLGSLQHARADADGLARIIAQLEDEAARVPALSEENRDLARRLEERAAETAALGARADELGRDLVRAREDAARAERRLETAERERSDLHRSHEDAKERLRVAGETVARLTREVERVQAAREKGELEIATLRAALAERDCGLEDARHAASAARLAAERDARLIAEGEEERAAQERRIAELSESLAAAHRRHDELEEAHDALREDHRALETARADLAIAFETKTYSLTGALSQERGAHEIARRLLDEAREAQRALAEENRNLKEQAVAMAREAEQMKHELGSTRTTIRDYGDRLGEANRRLAGAQDDQARLEAALSEARQENRAMARKVERLARIERENDELHEKVRALQESVGHYRRTAGDADESAGELVAIPFPARGREEKPKVALSGPGAASGRIAKLPRAR